MYVYITFCPTSIPVLSEVMVLFSFNLSNMLFNNEHNIDILSLHNKCTLVIHAQQPSYNVINKII